VIELGQDVRRRHCGGRRSYSQARSGAAGNHGRSGSGRLGRRGAYHGLSRRRYRHACLHSWAIAEVVHGLPRDIADSARAYLTDDLRAVLERVEAAVRA
jgi:hypothetical protein